MSHWFAHCCLESSVEIEIHLNSFVRIVARRSSIVGSPVCVLLGNSNTTQYKCQGFYSPRIQSEYFGQNFREKSLENSVDLSDHLLKLIQWTHPANANPPLQEMRPYFLEGGWHREIPLDTHNVLKPPIGRRGLSKSSSSDLFAIHT